MRPTTSCIGSPTYELSKFLALLLKHLYEDNYSVKNSKQFVDFVGSQIIKKDEQIVSFDVVSLFTSVPVQMAIDVVRDRLEETNAWEKHTSLTKNQICQIVRLCVGKQLFQI